MIERITPEPSQEELAAIRAALARRSNSASPAPAAWTLDGPDFDFDEQRAAGSRTRRS